LISPVPADGHFEIDSDKGRLALSVNSRHASKLGLLSVALVSLSLGLGSATPAEAKSGPYFASWPAELQTTILKMYRTFRGELMLYVEDVPSGVVFEHNAATPTYIASVVKLPFMIELFRQIQQGSVSLDEEIVYTADDLRDGSPVFNYVKVGTSVRLRVVLEAMIQQSDNAASDMIARRVGIARVNEGMKALGYSGFGPITSLIDVRRLIYAQLDPRVNDLTPAEIRAIGFAKGHEARVLKITDLLGELPGTYAIPDIDTAFRRYYASGYNSASMRQIGHVLRDLANGHLVDARASEQMLEVMLGTMTGPKRITSYLPPGTPVAHKTGTQYQRICDVGLFYVAKDHPVVFAGCTKFQRQRSQAEEVLARAARRTFELLAPPHRRAQLLDEIVLGDELWDEPTAMLKSSRSETSTAAKVTRRKRPGRKRGSGQRGGSRSSAD
jgi:beta-lactamase class A